MNQYSQLQYQSINDSQINHKFQAQKFEQYSSLRTQQYWDYSQQEEKEKMQTLQNVKQFSISQHQLEIINFKYLKEIQKHISQNKISCGCGLSYRTKTALKLHLLLKHGVKNQNQAIKIQSDWLEVQMLDKSDSSNITFGDIQSQQLDNKSIEYQNQQGYSKIISSNQQDKSEIKSTPRRICERCNRTYSCYSSLLLHMKRIHNVYNSKQRCSKNPFAERSFICICGSAYLSYSALCLHKKLKHADDPKIFYKQQKRLRNRFGQKNYHCGCGLSYTCSSALGFHIKVKHLNKPVKGTYRTDPTTIRKGRPRKYIYDEEEKPFSPKTNHCQKKDPTICSVCRCKDFKSRYIQCLKCKNHFLCEPCFSQQNQLQGDHDWVVRQNIQHKIVYSLPNDDDIQCDDCHKKCKEKQLWICDKCPDWNWCGHCREGKQSRHMRKHKSKIHKQTNFNK